MKKRLKGFFQRLARWLNVREMRHHRVKAGVYIIIRLILVSLVHRPKAVGSVAECA